MAGALTELMSTRLGAASESLTGAGAALLFVRVTVHAASWLRARSVGSQVCVIGTTLSATRAVTGSTMLCPLPFVEASVTCPKAQPAGAAVPSMVIVIVRVPPAGTENELGDTLIFRPLAPVVLALNGWARVVVLVRVRCVVMAPGSGLAWMLGRLRSTRSMAAIP